MFSSAYTLILASSLLFSLSAAAPIPSKQIEVRALVDEPTVSIFARDVPFDDVPDIVRRVASPGPADDESIVRRFPRRVYKEHYESKRSPSPNPAPGTTVKETKLLITKVVTHDTPEDAKAYNEKNPSPDGEKNAQGSATTIAFAETLTFPSAPTPTSPTPVNPVDPASVTDAPGQTPPVTGYTPTSDPTKPGPGEPVPVTPGTESPTPGTQEPAPVTPGNESPAPGSDPKNPAGTGPGEVPNGKKPEGESPNPNPNPATPNPNDKTEPGTPSSNPTTPGTEGAKPASKRSVPVVGSGASRASALRRGVS